MVDLVVPGMLVLSGLCLYAGANHLMASLGRPVDRTQLLFSVYCLLQVPYPIFQALALRATDPAQLVLCMKWTLGVGMAGFMILPWFIAQRTAVRPLPLLVAISALFALFLAVDILSPYSLQYSSLYGIGTMQLPWGEVVAVGHGKSSAWIQAVMVTWMVALLYAMYALIDSYRRRRRPSDLAILVAVTLFLLSSLQGFLVRMGVIDFIPLGSVGYLILTIVMSVVWNWEARQRLAHSERRFRLLVEQSPISMQLLDTDGTTRQVNAAWRKLFGQGAATQRSVLGDSALIANGAMPYIRRGFDGEAVEIPPVLHRGMTPTTDMPAGFDRWISARIYPIREQSGEIRDVILMHEDVTEKKRVEDAIRLIASGVSGIAGERFFRQFVASLAQLFSAEYAVIGLLDEGDPGRVNTLAVHARGEAVPDLTFHIADTPSAEVIGKSPRLYPQDVQILFPRAARLAEMRVESYLGAPLFDSDGAPIGLVAVMDTRPLQHAERAIEIIEIFAARAAAEVQRIEAETHVHRMAYFDYLTGLGSRASFHEQLSATVGALREHGGQSALLLLDLDHFKTINDALSHDVGDQVLRAVGAVLMEAVSEGAFVARLGGDEFAVLTHPCGETGAVAEASARRVAQQVLQCLQSPLFVAGREFTLGASVGVVMLPAQDDSGLDVVRHADMALYRAKRMGRGNIQFYTPELQEVVAERLHLEEGLRRAVQNDELQLHFQPQVDAAGRVIGAEALLRWTHPKLGSVSPGIFIPIAEEAGLIYGIGHWVLEQACRRLAAWRQSDQALTGHLSVNVSPWQFTRPDFVEQVREVIENHGVSTGSLLIELTESALLYDLPDAVEKLHQLRAMGLKVGLDDFGTGYSSLAHLRDLPLDQIKIDKNFVAELTPSLEHPLVETMVAIGRHMKLAVIAEGVETDRQLAMLKRFGCPGFQGYLICYPLAEAPFLEWIAQQQRVPAATG